MDFIFQNLLPAARDVALVVLATETIVVGVVILVLLFQTWKLVGAIRRHLDRLTGQASEILGTTADTARNVRGTTEFVGNHAARPVIEVLSILTAVAEFARAAFSNPKPNDRDGSRR